MSAAGVAEPHLVDECRNVLFVYSDGSIVRSPNPSFIVPVRDDGSIEWKDLPFGPPEHGLQLRLYRPRSPSPPEKKLPIYYYFHGGGFCIGSRTWPNVQNYCLRASAELGAVVIAPDYRLAPEHRLPAALHDSEASVKWLRSQAAAVGSESIDPWLAESADFRRVFISGDSAGGTICHHLSVRYGGRAAELEPIALRGYVQLMPFFGGTVRTESEANCPDETFLNRPLNDRFWRLSIPAGSTVDDPIVNPFGPGAPELGKIEVLPTMVVVGGLDLLRDRAIDYVERLKGMGKPVELADFEGQHHGFFTIDPWSDASGRLMGMVKQFIDDNGGTN